MRESSTNLVPRPASYIAALENERVRVLRQRVTWFCFVALSLVLLSFYGTLLDLDHPAIVAEQFRRYFLLSMGADFVLFVLFASMLAYLTLERPARSKLLTSVAILITFAAAIATYYEVNTIPFDPKYPPGARETIVQQLTLAVADTVLFQGLAMLIIPMRWRESARFLVPCGLIFLIALATLSRNPNPIGLAIWCSAHALPALGLAAFSASRYREFDAKLTSLELVGRFGEISQELEYARRIHEALFPPQVDRGPVKLVYRYEPMREIGGDFLFVHHPIAAGAMHLVLLDVSGHGVPAALAVNRLHDALQRFFAATPAGTPGELIRELNRYASDSLSPQGVFATAMALRIDAETGTIHWSSAGHPPAYLRQGTDLVELASTATMLGVLAPESFDPGEQTLTCARGARILSFTDGSFEAINRDRKPLGIQRIVEIFRESPTPGDAPRRIAAAVTEHRSGVPVADDLLIVEVAIEAA